jgi:hypothetical protein
VQRPIAEQTVDGFDPVLVGGVAGEVAPERGQPQASTNQKSADGPPECGSALGVKKRDELIEVSA